MPKKILVIDDDVSELTLIGARLTKAGYEVAQAGNGAQGLERAKQWAPDLIILDVQMPEMNGYTFMLEMKKNDAIKGIPVIVLTSHEDTEKIFYRRGVQSYLIKPVNFDQLFSKMSERLNEKPSGA